MANNLVTSTETILAPEGTGFGITYAGADAFMQSQTVDISTAGLYEFSVDANALTGTVNLSNSPTIPRPLLDGAFQLFAGSVFSSSNAVFTTDGWATYTWTTTLDVGQIDVGLRNSQSAVYSIAYDNFTITAVPVPAAIWLFGSGLIGLIGIARRKKA
ncbi:MAG: VPLPA-CTERM sorting domain-containing protein [Gammaproteobacteria bacterium]|nr:VPLPA-CTERM sorting domain-containing protein [Gammaproteobacteria bacterium]